MNIGILILMIVGGGVGILSSLYSVQLSGHDYLENLSQNPSWI